MEMRCSLSDSTLRKPVACAFLSEFWGRNTIDTPGSSSYLLLVYNVHLLCEARIAYGLNFFHQHYRQEFFMSIDHALSISVESAAWQDYRASNTAMIVFYTTDPVSELPIREIPEELPTEIIPDPNYESATYGFFGCAKGKIRTAFVKSKIRNLLFITKYAGTKEEFKDRFFITGYYRINKTADVKRLHVRNLADYSCLDEGACYALRAETQHFVSIDDAFEVTPAVLKEWGVATRLTRQTRITLDDEQTGKVIDYLTSKPDITEDLIAETERLWPHAMAVGEDDE